MAGLVYFPVSIETLPSQINMLHVEHKLSIKHQNSSKYNPPVSPF